MKNLYSPSMLKSYLSCKYIIFNEVNEKKLNLKKIELTKNDQLRLEKAFAECEVLGEMARGKMVTNTLSEVDDYWKNRNIVVDKCMRSKGFELK